MRAIHSILIAGVASAVIASSAAAGPPSWDKQIDTPGRFKVLGQFGGAAVLDKETGLVWEQSPGTTPFFWSTALRLCYSKTVGNRKGWRLPTIEELMSLVDPGNPGGDPDLPPGHPFDNVQSGSITDFYWSINSAGSGDHAIVAIFRAGENTDVDKNSNHFFWCVRGGHGHDAH